MLCACFLYIIKIFMLCDLNFCFYGRSQRKYVATQEDRLANIRQNKAGWILQSLFLCSLDSIWWLLVLLGMIVLTLVQVGLFYWLYFHLRLSLSWGIEVAGYLFFGSGMKFWSILVWYVLALFKFRCVDGGVWGGAALDFLFCDGVLCMRWNTATELL